MEKPVRIKKCLVFGLIVNKRRGCEKVNIEPYI